MDDRFDGIGERVSKLRGTHDIAVDERGIRKEILTESAGKIIEDRHPVSAGEERLDYMAADIAGAADY